MTFCKKQHMYNEPSRAILHVAGWADFVVSIYQNCNIDSRLNTRGEL